MPKEVKTFKKPSNKNFYFSSFYFTIYNEISKGLNPHKIALKYNVSKQQVHYYIKKLLTEGCIKKIGYGVWEAIKPPKEEVKKEVKKKGHHRLQPFIKPSSKKIRSHAFMFKLWIVPQENWENRDILLKKLGFSCKKVNKTGVSTVISGNTVVFYPRHIIVWDKHSYISDSPKKNKQTAIQSLKSFIVRLNNLFKIELKIRRFKCLKEHHSLLNNEMAKAYEQEHKKLEVSDEYGRWANIDNSFNLHEFEVYKNKHPNPNQAINDTDGVARFFNDLKKTNFEATPSFLMEMIGKVTQNQLIFAENMQSHIHAIKTLAKNVDELTRLIKKLNGVDKNVV